MSATAANNSPPANNWDFYDPQYGTASGPVQTESRGRAPAEDGGPRLTKPQRPPWLTWALFLGLILLLTLIGSSYSFVAGPSQPIVDKRPTTHMLPGPVQPSNLPPQWVASGRGWAEFFEATNVAETFVARYESLDWRSVSTFDAATFAMTDAALVRFRQSDERATSTFIAQFQSEQKIQVAVSEDCQAQQIQQTGGMVFVWMLVTYQLLQQQPGTTTQLSLRTMTVLLVAVPLGTNGIAGGIGWEVSAWRPGTIVFPVPGQP